MVPLNSSSSAARILMMRPVQSIFINFLLSLSKPNQQCRKESFRIQPLRLLLAEGGHRIDARGAARWKKRGEKRDQQEQEGRCREAERIIRLHIKQHAGDGFS